MDHAFFNQVIHSQGEKDYEVYIRTAALHACQKDVTELCNGDELTFQMTHQVEELWAKLVVYTLLQIDDTLRARNTQLTLTYFARVHSAMHKMCDSMNVLETMSPKRYQEIRTHLGNGSGSESPGFRAMLKVSKPLWDTYEANYLKPSGRTVAQVYDAGFAHDEAFVLAEAMITYDELFQKFRYTHLKLVQRTIGLGTSSIKGRPVDLLEETSRSQFYPQLWAIRHQMTESWGNSYGVVRPSMSAAKGDVA